jgi:hypothetical protein
MAISEYISLYTQEKAQIDRDPCNDIHPQNLETI